MAAKTQTALAESGSPFVADEHEEGEKNTRGSLSSTSTSRGSRNSSFVPFVPGDEGEGGSAVLSAEVGSSAATSATPWGAGRPFLERKNAAASRQMLDEERRTATKTRNALLLKDREARLEKEKEEKAYLDDIDPRGGGDVTAISEALDARRKRLAALGGRNGGGVAGDDAISLRPGGGGRGRGGDESSSPKVRVDKGEIARHKRRQTLLGTALGDGGLAEHMAQQRRGETTSTSSGGGGGGGGDGGGGVEGHLGRHRLKIAGKNRGRNPPTLQCVCCKGIHCHVGRRWECRLWHDKNV